MTLEQLQSILTFSAALIGLATLVGGGVHRYWLHRKRKQFKTVVEHVKKSNLSDPDKLLVVSSLRGLRTLLRVAMVAIVLLVGISICLWFFEPADRRAMSRLASEYDSAVFRDSRDGLYNIARVFESTEDLKRNSVLSSTIDDAKVTFDLLATHAKSILDGHRQNIVEAIKRGVRFRIVLLDPSQSNKEVFDSQCRATQHRPQMMRSKVAETVIFIRDLQQQVEEMKDTFKGSIECRCVEGPLFHSMWIRDGAGENSLVHVGLYLHAERGDWPSFRVSRTSSEELVEKANEEFESIWRSAKAITEIQMPK